MKAADKVKLWGSHLDIQDNSDGSHTVTVQLLHDETISEKEAVAHHVVDVTTIHHLGDLASDDEVYPKTKRRQQKIEFINGASSTQAHAGQQLRRNDDVLVPVLNLVIVELALNGSGTQRNETGVPRGRGTMPRSIFLASRKVSYTNCFQQHQ